MKSATILVRRRLGHQPLWGGAFAEGLRKHGWQASIREQFTGRADLVVIWGVRNKQAMDLARRNGAAICILERGYLGDRFKWTSVSFGGGLNNRGEFRGASDDPERFNTHFPSMMKPWCRKEDGYALLIGQVPGDMSLAPRGGALQDWYPQAAEAMRRRGYEVRFRPHPGAVQRGYKEAVPGAVESTGSLESALAGAAVCVTFNSNTSVEAVLAGVPTIACDEGCMAWPVVAQGLDAEITTPDRRAWAARLAWCQWTLEEMASGECWASVGEQHG